MRKAEVPVMRVDLRFSAILVAEREQRVQQNKKRFLGQAAKFFVGEYKLKHKREDFSWNILP